MRSSTRLSGCSSSRATRRPRWRRSRPRHGVALKTVYVAFETKSGVLRSLWHLLLRGDQEDVPVPERPWYREIVEERDPERQLRLIARSSRLVKMRAAAADEGDPQRRVRRPRRRGAVEPHPDRLLRRPAPDRRDPAQEEGVATRPRRRPGDRHPVDAQPSRPVASAGRRARLDARAATSSGSATPSARSCSRAGPER